MFNDMAVPDEQTRIIEQGLDPCDFGRISDDHVFETPFPVFRRPPSPAIKFLAIDYLKLHLVDMDGMSICIEVVDLPDLDGVQGRVLRNRIVPAHVHGIPICVNCAEQGCPWADTFQNKPLPRKK
jgi:hypothetical protein